MFVIFQKHFGARLGDEWEFMAHRRDVGKTCAAPERDCTEYSGSVEEDAEARGESGTTAHSGYSCLWCVTSETQRPGR